MALTLRGVCMMSVNGGNIHTGMHRWSKRLPHVTIVYGRIILFTLGISSTPMINYYYMPDMGNGAFAAATRLLLSMLTEAELGTIHLFHRSIR